jgi:hypothetical protein
LLPVIIQLREKKEYTFAQIADWINSNSETKVKAGSVFAVYKKYKIAGSEGLFHQDEESDFDDAVSEGLEAGLTMNQVIDHESREDYK